jgi:hypothetical protein
VIVTPIPHNLDLGHSGPRSSDYLHMSDIYNRMYEKLGKEQEPLPDETKRVLFELGLAWESVLEEALKRRPTFEGEDIERPGELIGASGIRYNPDLLILKGGVVRLGEIKLKWQSSKDWPRERSNRLPSKVDKDVTQMKGYCHELGTTLARYYVFFVNGDWKPPLPHAPLVYDVEFTQAEIDEEWAALMNFARGEGML